MWLNLVHASSVLLQRYLCNYLIGVFTILKSISLIQRGSALCLALLLLSFITQLIFFILH